MTTFGRLVGDWDVVVEFLQEDGSWLRAEGEWHFGWVLRGRAVQDVWTVYRPGAQQRESDDLLGYGTTIRVYDERTELWHVNWVGVLNHNYTLFSARAEGDEIVQNAVDDEGDPFQWIFYDISDDSFRWRAQSLTEGGWDVQQRMTVMRRPKSRRS
jgi:hypothetical protein